MIAFASPTTIVANDFERTIHESPCGRYRVILSHCLLAQNAKPEDRLPDVWYAMRHVDGRWQIVSRHRVRTAAERSALKAQRLDIREERRAARLIERKRRNRRRRRIALKQAGRVR